MKYAIVENIPYYSSMANKETRKSRLCRGALDRGNKK